jgi:hypothetical protein
MQGKELEDLRRDADFYSQLHTRNNYSVMNVTREDEFDGLRVYVIEAVRKDGRKQELYYAKDLGFEVGRKDFYDPPEESRTSFYEDYQQVDGPSIKIPTKIRMISGNTNIRVVFQEILPNAQIPASAFVKPEKSARDAAGAGKDDHPDNGRVTDGVYRNDFFGFTYTLPKGWTVHGPETEKVLMETGKELIAGDNEEKKKMMDAANKRTFHLLTAFEFPLGTPGKANRSLQLLAENVAFAPGIRDGKDYILNLDQVLSRGQLQMTYEGEPVEESIDGVKFYRQNMRAKIGEIPIYEVVYSTKMGAYAICYIITARDKEGAEEVAQSILTFQKTPGKEPKP